MPTPAAVETKLASRLARQIRAEVIADGWPVGRLLGGEAELLEKYEVSRAAFREAVRLLEHLGVAEMRRGPGGGLVVTEPSMASTVEAVITYLAYENVSLNEVMETRFVLEESLASLAAERVTDTQITHLREQTARDARRVELLADDHHLLHSLIARTVANPAAELFVEILGGLSARWAYPQVNDDERNDALADSAKAHRIIVDAIAAGNGALAQQRMRRHLQGLGDWMGQRSEAPRSRQWRISESTSDKLGHRVANEILSDIIAAGWPVGTLLGSETDLIERYQVSRAGVREGIRLLEHHQAARMRRGPGGGLFVTAPDVGPIVEAAAIYLQFRSLEPSHLTDLRIGLELHAVERATTVVNTADISRLRELENRRTISLTGLSAHDEFHAFIAHLGGNTVISLFVLVLATLTEDLASTSPRVATETAALMSHNSLAHAAIVDAIAAGDGPLARRRLQQHLSALQPYLQQRA